jgi:DNA-binding NarL/FixJ family response regulator
LIDRLASLGIAAAAGICARTSARVLILTTYDLDEHVYDALRAGASGSLLKTMRGRNWSTPCGWSAAGEALLAPTVTRRGLSNVEIAAELFVTEHTVKAHVSNLLAKLGLRDRVQAVVLAYESGLVVARGGPGHSRE